MFQKRPAHSLTVCYNGHTEGGPKKFIICYFLLIRAAVLMVLGAEGFSTELIPGFLPVPGGEQPSILIRVWLRELGWDTQRGSSCDLIARLAGEGDRGFVCSLLTCIWHPSLSCHSEVSRALGNWFQAAAVSKQPPLSMHCQGDWENPCVWVILGDGQGPGWPPLPEG